MNEAVDFKSMINTSRGKVYLLWAVIVGAGFVSTHYYQNSNINIVWAVLSIIGFAYMYKVMPLGASQMKRIFMAWLIPVSIGMIWSVVAVMTDLLPELVYYLGSFWLIVMAAGYVWNGLVDRPGLWYYVVGVVNLIAAGVIYLSFDLLFVQYLLVAVVGVWSMLMLWLFRADT